MVQISISSDAEMTVAVLMRSSWEQGHFKQIHQDELFVVHTVVIVG